MRRPSTSPSRTSSSTLACVTSNTSGSSTRTPASESIVKKRRCQPVLGSQSKNFSRRSASAQKGFSSTVAMWFGTMSSSTPSPAEQSSRKAASPPRSSEMRVGSATS